MRIPEVQARMRHLANNTNMPSWAKDELRTLAKELSRRKPKVKGEITSVPMSNAIRARIREMAQEGFSQLETARTLHISSGRVSETLRGERV